MKISHIIIALVFVAAGYYLGGKYPGLLSKVGGMASS